MTTTVSAADMVHELAARYQEINGMGSVEVAFGDDRIILRAGAVAGIRILRPLADLVREELRRRDLRTPTIEHVRTGSLMFITNAAPPKTPWDNALFKHFAARTVIGSLIALPGPGDELRNWLDASDGTLRVDFDDLARITIEATATGRQHGGR
ncbi:hypothetical protein AB0B25_07835 [Nocardia sp. NPDC049190]|uniref:hypothetical protein n=1 Tax=Nocardia sp. NPDC049190 TaxID=3155650 RepID=UPI0033CA5F41